MIVVYCFVFLLLLRVTAGSLSGGDELCTDCLRNNGTMFVVSGFGLYSCMDTQVVYYEGAIFDEANCRCLAFDASGPGGSCQSCVRASAQCGYCKLADGDFCWPAGTNTRSDERFGSMCAGRWTTHLSACPAEPTVMTPWRIFMIVGCGRRCKRARVFFFVLFHFVLLWFSVSFGALAVIVSMLVLCVHNISNRKADENAKLFPAAGSAADDAPLLAAARFALDDVMDMEESSRALSGSSMLSSDDGSLADGFQYDQ